MSDLLTELANTIIKLSRDGSLNILRNVRAGELPNDAVNLSQIQNIQSSINELNNKVFKFSYYQVITGTSGTITPPSGATFLENQFGASGNAILSRINPSGFPIDESPRDVSNDPVTVTLTIPSGAYVVSSAYVDASVALIYSISVKLSDFASLDQTKIIGNPELIELASQVPYDNTSSGLTSKDVQAAIDELKTLIVTLSAFDYIDFNNILVPPAHQNGRTFKDPETHALTYFNDISGFSHNLGYEHVVRVINNTGVTIPDGKAVYISGIDINGVPEISLAKADVSATAISLGLTTTSMDDGEIGIVTQFGFVHDLDTSAFSVNDRVHVSETVAGELQTAEPLLNSEIGFVLVSHATEGVILIYNRPVSITKKHIFFLADYDANYLTYRAKTVAGSGIQRFTFAIPSDFVSLNSINLIGSPNAGAALAARNIDLYSTYGKSGEADAAHTQSDTIITYDLSGQTAKKVKFDIASVFSSIEANDICGLQIEHQAIGGTITYYCIELIYTGFN